MNREIKFRAIQRDLAHEQFPNTYEKRNLGFCYGTGIYYDGVSTWMIGVNKENKTFSQMEAVLVDPATVGQYTGLKDRNGKEIYEGDIIEIAVDKKKCPIHMRDVKPVNAEIMFTNFHWSCSDGGGKSLYNYTTIPYTTIEVIGNVIEHSHLLGGEGS